ALFFHSCGLFVTFIIDCFITSLLHFGAQNFRYFIQLFKENDMASYLLLRNNKESGPFSVGDLVNFGLKPYDLVWIEGKSAAWRYPSEIEELKPYAPAVEEQPFDRFFKKPSPISSQETPIPAQTT